MHLRRTMFITSRGVKEAAKLEIYEAPVLSGRDVQGYWVLDTNRIILSPELYGEFAACTTQKAQGLFCSHLRMIEQLKLPEVLG